MTSSLRGATVLVTGGAGLIGSHIVDRLINAGAGEIRVLDNLVRGGLENLAPAMKRVEITFLKGDIRDAAMVRRAVAGCEFVFHQAALRITHCAEQPRECMDVLVMGTFNVLQAAAEAGVRKVVYASSASVYGAAEVFPTAELHHPYHNRTLYGSAKLMNEGMARHFHDMACLPSVGLRYFNVYGPRMDVTGAYTEVFIRWLHCIEQNVRPQIHGDGQATMDFVFVDDIARANILAATANAVDSVYNIASGTETSLLQLWQNLKDVTGAHHLEPEFQPARKVNPVPRRLADTSQARHDLGFTAAVPLPEGLRRLLTWRNQFSSQLEAVA